MMTIDNRKGFAPILVIAVVVGVIVIGVVDYFVLRKPVSENPMPIAQNSSSSNLSATTTTPTTVSADTTDHNGSLIDQIQIGQRVASFVVGSINRDSGGNIVSINYTGQATVAGSGGTQTGALKGKICFWPTSDDIAKIPHLAGDNKGIGFCFTNEIPPSVIQAMDNATGMSGDVSITIKDYTEVVNGSEPLDIAQFVTLSPTPYAPLSITSSTILSSDRVTYTYNNFHYGVSFKYPASDTFIPDDSSDQLYRPSNFLANDAVIMIGQVQIPRKAYPNTNFVGARFAIFSNTNSDTSTCSQFLSVGPQDISSTTINGIPYAYTDSGGAAAGTETDFQDYHAFMHGICYEFHFEISWFNRGSLSDPNSVAEFTDQNLSDLINSFLKSITFSIPQGWPE